MDDSKHSIGYIKERINIVLTNYSISTLFMAKCFCNLRVNCIFVYNFGVVMTGEGKELLSNFEARLRHLMYLYDELKQKNNELILLFEQEKEEKKKLQQEYQELEKKYKNLKFATTINVSSSDIKESKLRIDSLVREIDKCIAQLNE